MSESDRVREAREAVRALMTVTHPYSCAGVMRPCLAGDPATIDNARCDCGAKHLRDERLDAYAEAIRAECAAEIAALKADAERLDWLNARGRVASQITHAPTWGGPESWWVWRVIGEMERGYRTGQSPDIRAEIDAARASEPRGRE